ncbi:MAG: polysaccharide deacetylase family protein [Verrucomicrobiia bacterium]
MEPRLERGLRTLLMLLEKANLKATMFWLGWAAERYSGLVQECHAAGHEIASHGYGHVLAYQVGRKAFREDALKAKEIIEDIVRAPVSGFRAPGFGITSETPWAHEVLAELQFKYDSSIFPARRGHGGYSAAPVEPFRVETSCGLIDEVPISVVSVLGRRLALFGGGYLRLAPLFLIRWGCRRLAKRGLPVVFYVHPREVDPDHPRLPLSFHRRFKCYVNLKSTYRKLENLCQAENMEFRTIKAWLGSAGFQPDSDHTRFEGEPRRRSSTCAVSGSAVTETVERCRQAEKQAGCKPALRHRDKARENGL